MIIGKLQTLVKLLPATAIQLVFESGRLKSDYSGLLESFGALGVELGLGHVVDLGFVQDKTLGLMQLVPNKFLVSAPGMPIRA